MGFKTVLSSTGQGSWFGYGRFLGVHLPLGTKLGKALDPFINLWTLKRLSRSNDEEIKKAVTLNLAHRINEKKPADEVRRIFEKFDREILTRALLELRKWRRTKSLDVAWIFDQKDENCSLLAFEYLESELSAEELDEIACHNKLSKIHRKIIQNPETGRRTLLNFARRKDSKGVGGPDRYDDKISFLAFSVLEDNLKFFEIELILRGFPTSEIKERIRKNPRIVNAEDVKPNKHPLTFAQKIAKMIFKVVPKQTEARENILREAEKGEAEEIVCYEFSEEDLRKGTEILALHTPEKQSEILEELEKMDSGLAAILKELIS